MKRKRVNKNRRPCERSAATRELRDTASVTVRGRVTRLFVSEPRYSAGRFKPDEGAEITFSGTFMCAERDPLVLVGRWVHHPRFGQQLKVVSYRYDEACLSTRRRGSR